MELSTRSDLTENICRGCLSLDRILQTINNEEVKQIYFTIIQEKFHTLHSGPLVLCWECIANIKRYLKFRQQCVRAHTSLTQYMLYPTTITSLSKLTAVKNNIQIHINKTSEDIESTDFDNNITDLQNQTDDKKCDKIKTVTYKESSQDETQDIKSVGVKETDIQFIKIEDDVLGDDYFGDDFQNDDCKDFDVDLVLENGKKKIMRNEENLVNSEFNDSDEEPLNNKKRKKIIKERKRKKKDNDVSKIVKKPGSKREKPSGVVSNPRVLKKLKDLNVSEEQLEMVLLSWEEVEEERQRAVSSVVFTRHEYRCRDCVVGFNHKFKLENHMVKHDLSSGPIICTVCKVRFKDSHALSAHKRRHRVRWRCRICGVTSSRAAVAADHVSREHHAPPPTHTCTVCGHAEPTLGKLRNHIKNHSERQTCELCHKSFRDRTSLKAHLFIHKGVKEYSCPRCDKRFLFKKAMEVHLVTHDAPALLYCVQCDMNFKNRMSYTQHMKYSLKHIDPAKLKYACPLCDKKFVKSSRLEEHKLAVHLKLTPITCAHADCSFACSSRAVLRTHVRMVHRNGRAQRNHVCHTCGKTYATKKSLEAHLRSHTGERPFCCPLCPSTFGYEAALYNHNKLVHLKLKNCRVSQQPSTIPTSESNLNIT